MDTSLLTVNRIRSARYPRARSQDPLKPIGTNPEEVILKDPAGVSMGGHPGGITKLDGLALGGLARAAETFSVASLFRRS